MKKGTKQFSLAASNAYSSKSLEEKQELKKRCCESSKTLTAKNVKQTGRKVFKTINMQVSECFLDARVPTCIFLHVLIGSPGFLCTPTYREPRVPTFPYL